jgi:hypothetical protein
MTKVQRPNQRRKLSCCRTHPKPRKMNFLTPDDCRAWAASHSFPFKSRPRYGDLEGSGFAAYKFTIPSDAGRRVTLARLLWESTAQGKPEALLWITDWSVWPSGEHMPLALTLRTALGENRPIADAPGHLFRMGEDDNALSFLSVALLFLWDAYLLSASGEIAVFLSHDECGVVLARNPDAGLPIQKRLALFGEAAA